MAEGAYVWKVMANGKEVEIGKWVKAQCPVVIIQKSVMQICIIKRFLLSLQPKQ